MSLALTSAPRSSQEVQHGKTESTISACSGSGGLSYSESSSCFSSACPSEAGPSDAGQSDDFGFQQALPVLLGGRPLSAEKEEQLLRTLHRKWTAELQDEMAVQRKAELDDLLKHTREQMLIGPTKMPANRYGSDASLPAFDKEKHVPTLALINPHSGAKAGFDILAIARKAAYYQRRFFNIIDVVRDQRRGGLLDVFRLELCAAKEEAQARGLRPRVISGGGDGTASFALFVVFQALKADPARADEGLEDAGNGFIWSDDELAECFPALAQMPLGSANDFGHTLGWGHKYPGDGSAAPWRSSNTRAAAALGGLRAWLGAVLEPRSREANFDMWGVMPAAGEESCNFKVCELSGETGADPRKVIDGEKQLLMREASTPVPLFCCLYFSVGFFAYMTARFQMNRHAHPLLNKLEYARQAVGITTETLPPQLGSGLSNLSISCGGDAYFPPRSEQGNTGGKYVDAGFLNINWQGGMAHGADRAPACARACATREPAKFNDAKVDMYRLKLSSPFRMPGPRYQTDKKEGPITFTHSGGRGKGVFFQWDGEARFAFSPTGEPFSIEARRILSVPVVLGPGYDPRVTGDSDNGQAVRFEFAGATHEEREEVKTRILRCVRGELDKELNATREELVAAGFHCEER